jgi:alpha-glucosidase
MEASRQPDRAFHETVLPFTRFLAGHGDYSPVLFGERRGNTTWAHQIALPVVFNESLITYAASPQHLLENPAVEMIKSIPATWDQTIVLAGSEIGESAIFARRSGKTWFLGVLNGPAAKKIEVPLAFLGEGSYAAMTVSDRPGESAAVDVKNHQSFDRSAKIALDLPAGGGYVARFTPRGSGDSK